MPLFMSLFETNSFEFLEMHRFFYEMACKDAGFRKFSGIRGNKLLHNYSYCFSHLIVTRDWPPSVHVKRVRSHSPDFISSTAVGLSVSSDTTLY